MGISANQARLMTLTARQHDLELRAQQISAQKMIKSLNSQKWAMEYSEKLNIFNLQKQQSTQVGYFKEIPTPITQEWLNEKGYGVYTTGQTKTQAAAGSDYDELINSGTYAVYKRTEADANTPTNEELNKYFHLQQPTILGGAPDRRYQRGDQLRSQIFNAYVDQNFPTEDGPEVLNMLVSLYDSGLDSDDFYQFYSVPTKDENGKIFCKIWIPEYSTDPSTAVKIELSTINIEDMMSVADLSNNRYIYDPISDRPEPTYEYVPYDGFLDIDVVKAEYDAAVSSLTADEKLLDMELTQINTEHKAVKTEYDSVKGLVGENVDKSFNVFG